MRNPDTRSVNEAFAALLSTQEGRTKLASTGQTMVRDHLREESAYERLAPADTVNPNDSRVVPTLNSDDLMVRKDLEPGSRAFAITWDSDPDAQMVSTRRIDIGFYTISTPLYEIREESLMSYEFPLTQVIKENAGYDLQEIYDQRWQSYVEAAVQTTGRIVKGEEATAFIASGAPGTFRGRIQRGDMVSLAQSLLESGNRKRMRRGLMNDVDFTDVMRWRIEDFGDAKVGEIVVDGYKYDKLMSYEVVRSIKTDLFQTGNIYGFPDKEFWCHSYILRALKSHMTKVNGNLIQFKFWKTVGGCVANISGVAKLELYAGASDTLPSETDLFQQTNPVFDGTAVFPTVVFQ